MFKKNQPLYIQIKEIIRTRIISGIYAENSYLPTEQEFAKEFNVSLVTIRQAIEHLQSENYVLKMSGRGTKVINTDVINRFSTAKSFTKILSEESANIEKKIISLEIENEPNEFFNNSHTIFKRCYYLNDSPYMYTVHFINDNLSNCVFTNLYALLFERGHIFSEFKDRFFIIDPDEEIQNILNTTDNLLCRERKTFDENNNLIEVSYSYYNTKIRAYEFNFTV